MFYRKRDQNHLKSSCPESYFLVKLVVGGGGGWGLLYEYGILSLNVLVMGVGAGMWGNA